MNLDVLGSLAFVVLCKIQALQIALIMQWKANFLHCFTVLYPRASYDNHWSGRSTPALINNSHWLHVFLPLAVGSLFHLVSMSAGLHPHIPLVSTAGQERSSGRTPVYIHNMIRAR
jgi:hypothetical protein